MSCHAGPPSTASQRPEEDSPGPSIRVPSCARAPRLRLRWEPAVKSRLTKQKNYGGRACKPDSVRRATRKNELHTAAIIPLGRASRRDSSSLPEGFLLQRLASLLRERVRFREFAQRAGPALPSYLALHHAGFSVPPMLPSERWALTPPFHPCQTNQLCPGCEARRFSKTSRRFPCAMPPCCAAGGIFSVALSVTEPHRVEWNSTPPVQVLAWAGNSALQRSLRGRPLALPGALPYFVTGSCEPTTTVSGLSSRPDCSGPAITRPVRQFLL